MNNKENIYGEFKKEDEITSLEDFEPNMNKTNSSSSKRPGKNKINLEELRNEVNSTTKNLHSSSGLEHLKPNKIKEQINENPKFMSQKNKPVIEFTHVGLEYELEEALIDINLKIYKGEFVYLVGESGAGKSSVIKMIYREVKNTKGDILIKNENITKFKNSQLPRLRRMVGVIFQDYKLLKDKTIFKNVSYSLEVTRYPKKKIKDRVNEILDKVGILEHADKYPNELSGGQQQRAAIARAIVDDPEFLVADEPTGNLDPENALAIMEILEKINNEGTTVIMATHDVGIVNNFPKRVVLIGNGKVIKETKGEYIYE